jgi:hypothetical protein
MRPVIGDSTCVYTTLMRAVSTAARASATSASARARAAMASSFSCWDTAFAAISGA